MGEQSGWQLAGTAPERYEQFIVPAFLDTSKELVALAALQEGERVLDVACGTGIIARLAAPELGDTGKIIGVDLNEGMLNIARKASQDQHSIPITWRQCDVSSLSLSDISFDVVFCQHGLEFFADRVSGLRELLRVLAPGGRLMLRVWRALKRQPFYVALFEALDRHIYTGAGTPIQAAFQLSNADELRNLVRQAGFRDAHLRFSTNTIRFPSLEEYVLGYLPATPIASEIAAMDEQARTAFVRDMTTLLQEFIDDGGLAAPSESHIVIAQK